MLELKNVTVSYQQGGEWLDAVRDVSFSVEAGQTYGLVGESGSGKSTLALAVLRYLSENGSVRSGSVRLAGHDVLALSQTALNRFWREQVKFVPQNPLPSLNPSHRVGRQLVEAVGRDAPGRRALELLERVGLADPERVARSYPHELSGGMQQRVMIAMALAGKPQLLVLDEPTTNLDVTTEATILDLVGELTTGSDTAVLYVSHNLGVVAQVCDRVGVLYAGELVEDAPVADLYRQPLHPYTQGLLDSVPKVGQDKRKVVLRPLPGRIPDLRDLPPACVYAPRCPLAIEVCQEQRPALERPDESRQTRCHRWEEIARGEVDPRQAATVTETPPATERGEEVLELADVHKRFALPRSLLDTVTGKPKREVRAVGGVDLSLARGRTLGLVGESGSGKSTLARCIIGLLEPESGEIRLLDLPLKRGLENRDLKVLRQLQMVFQSSEEALNPYHSVGHILRRPFQRLAGHSRAEADAAVAELLRSVKLNPSYASRLPGQLSGGERQRVAIARAFAAKPDLLLFDESVSGLDVSVQAAILNLLNDLQVEGETSYLFVSHDLSVVSYLADDIAVIYLGQLMEVGRSEDVLEPPYHPYTEALLSAIPLIDTDEKRAAKRLTGEVPSQLAVPSGCPFHTRCPRFLGEVCATETPPWQEDERGNRIFCHIPLEELKLAQERVFTFEADPRA